MNAKAEAVVAEAEEAGTVKEGIYTQIDAWVKTKTGKRIGKTGGREIFDLVTGGVFSAAASEGTFRFNGGFGSLHVKEYQAGERRLPSGQTTKFGKRRKIRYEEGVVVKALVDNGGDLAKAIAVRGSRAKPEVAKAGKPAAAGKGEDLSLD